MSDTLGARTAPIAMIFSFNENLVLQALNGLGDEELWHAPSDRNNGMLWVAGHLVQTRAKVLGFLGEAVDTGWGPVFNRGATRAEADRYPTRDEVERVMRDIGPRLRARLLSLDDNFLAGPATLNVPGTKTVADELAFFALHDAYHVGQMAYIRKSLGYPGVVG